MMMKKNAKKNTNPTTYDTGGGFLGSWGRDGDFEVDGCNVELRVKFDRETFPQLEVDHAEVSIPLGPDDAGDWIIMVTPKGLSSGQAGQLIENTMRLCPGFAASVKDVKGRFDAARKRDQKAAE